MGSASLQGPLWGAEARDWSQLMEQTMLPLFGAALDVARVTTGSRVLDAGCGSGLAAVLAHLRGAEVSAIDASVDLLEIARQRLPGADIREADLEDLPFADDSFDAVIAVNSVFYAADPIAALRELRRVVRPDGRVVVTSWGPATQCEYGAVIRGLGALLPPPPPGAPPGGPFALSEPGALENVLDKAGLRTVERGEVSCPYVFPNNSTAWRGSASSGVAQRAIVHSGEAAVRTATEEADRAYTRSDGMVRYDNVFIWLTAVPQ
jgi:SAM-dependent methyltransferase